MTRVRGNPLPWAIGPAVVLLVSPAWAAAGSEGGRVGLTLFAIAVLVTSAKIGGLVVERWGQPAVLGELLVGIGLIVMGGLSLVDFESSFSAEIMFSKHWAKEARPEQLPKLFPSPPR